MTTKFRVKRSTVSGITPTTGDIDSGELAINIPDRKLFTSNGTAVFELGSNLNNLSVSGNLTIGSTGDIVLTPGAGIFANGSLGSNSNILYSNGTSVYWGTANAGISAVVSQQFTANGTANSFTVSGGYIPSAIEVYVAGVKQIPGTDVTITSGSTINFAVPPLNGQIVDVFGYQSVGGIGSFLALTGGTLTGNLTFTNGSVIIANGSFGTNGQVLTSNGTSLYWSSAGFANGQSISVNNFVVTGAFTANGANGTSGQVLTSNSTGVYWSTPTTGTVTSVATGNGLTGGPITSTGTVSVLANSGIVANSTGIFVNTAFIGTLSANNASFLGGTSAASYQLNSTLAANVATLTANNANNLNGQAASFYTNATNISTGTLANARLPSAIDVTSVNATSFGVTGTTIFSNSSLARTLATFIIPGASTEGGQLVLGYGNGLATSISGQSNNTFNIDVFGGNTGSTPLLRIFTQNGDGTTTSILNASNTGRVHVGSTSEQTDSTFKVTGTANVTGNVTIGGISTFNANVILGSSGLSANGGFGTAGQVLSSNGTSVYWNTPTTGTVTSVATGNGLTGGPVTSTGTVSVLANSGIVANSTGVFVNTAFIGTLSANNASFLGGTAAASYQLNSTLAANVATLTANNANNLNGQAASFYTNASNLSTGTLPDARLSSAVVNTSSAFTITGTRTFNANVTFGSAAAFIANASPGTSGQVLTSNGTGVYWAAAAAGVNTAAQYAWTNTHTFAANVTFNTNTLFVDATNNRVGVGTAAPSQRLEVSQGGALNAYVEIDQSEARASSTARSGILLDKTGVNQFALTIDGGVGANGVTYYEAKSATGQHVFFTDTTEKLRIVANGNVGIGNSAPTEKLQVQGNIQLQNGASTANTVRNAGIRFWTDNAFGSELHWGDTASGLSSGWATALYGRRGDTVAVRIGAYPSSNTSQNTFSEYVTVLNNGNVGVGALSPAARLEISSSAASHNVLQISQTNTSFNTDVTLFNAANQTSTTLISKRTDGGLWFWQSNANYIASFTSGTERMRIAANGFIGIGTSSPAHLLDVSGSGTQTIRAITTDTSGVAVGRLMAQYTGGGGGTASAIDIRAGDGYSYIVTTTNTAMLFGTNGSERMRIDTSGNIGIGTTTPITTNARLSVRASDDYSAGLTIGSQSTAANWARLDFKNTNVPQPAILYQDQAGTFSIRTEAAYPIRLLTNGENERMRVAANGFVGIANTTPDATLAVTGTANVSGNVVIGGALTTTNVTLRSSGSNGATLSANGTSSGLWLISNTFSLSAVGVTGPRDIFFRPNGLTAYIVDGTSDTVIEYPLSSAWNISTLGAAAGSVAAGETAPEGVFFRDNGTRMFVIGSSGDAVREFALSTAWSVNTATFTTSFSIAQDTAPASLAFSNTGSKLFVLGGTNDSVFEYDLSTPWSVNTAVYNSQSLSVTTQDTQPFGLSFNSTGTRMVITGIGRDAVFFYRLTTPWSVNTAIFEDSRSLGNESRSALGVFVEESQNKAWVVDDSGDRIIEYNTNAVGLHVNSAVNHIRGITSFTSNVGIVDTLHVGNSITVENDIIVVDDLVVSGDITFSTTTGTLNMGTSQTTGAVTIGGITQTGAIQIGRSTANQTLSIANGVTASGSTKIVNIGTSGAAGSNTTINIGSNTGTGEVVIAQLTRFATANAVVLPAGNTASRPTAANGMIRYNTNTNTIEAVANNTWTNMLAAYSSVREQFTASNNQTTFTVTGGYVPGQIDVYYNGVKLRSGSEVNISSGSTVVLAAGAANNALIEVVGIGPTFVVSNTAQIAYQQFTASNNQTTFTVTNGYVPGQVDVFADGVKLVNGVDVNVSSGGSVVLSTGVPNNTIVEVKGYSTPLVSAQTSTAVRQTFTANATVNNNFTVTGGYIPGQVDVFYNGAKLVNGSDVNTSSGTTIVLTSNAASGAIVDVVGINYFTAGGGVTTPVRQQLVATANQTTFTITGGYTPGQIDVFRNGVKLTPGADVNISGGSTVVLSSPAANGDNIDVVGFAATSYQDSVRKSGDTISGSLGISANLAVTGAATFSNTVAVTGNVTTSGVFTDPTGTIRPIVQGTSQTATGTFVDFTGIPSWVRRITVMFNGVSTNGTSLHLIQLGTSSGIVSTGYSGTTGNRGGEATSTVGFQPWWNSAPNAAWLWSGSMIITNVAGNTWNQITSMNAPAGPTIGFGSGVISLAGTLDRVRVTTVNGTDAFDAGTINILYE